MTTEVTESTNVRAGKTPACLWIIIPCYNEEAVLPETAPMFLQKINDLISAGKVSEDSRILFVNDGSKDRTWEIIRELSEENPHYTGIAQSRNRGHQNALVAGMMEAVGHCDAVITIDCDGQDDINAMDRMMDEYYNGCDIVYGVRSDRTSDTWFKRTTAQTYYKVLNWFGAEVVYNHADYRLVSEKVLRHFADFKEVNIYLRGMFPLIGFKSTSVYYERHERLAGESHYPLKKMISLAVEGITSFSVKPLAIIGRTGLVISFLGLIGIIWVLIGALLGHTISGWASLMCVVIFLGGVQLISLGVIGEYVGKTYMESKHRPRYIISERTWDKDTQEDSDGGSV